MTFAAHAALGGMLYAVPARAIGAPAEMCGAAWMLGAQLGAMPDVLPWVVGCITGRGDLDQWLRKVLHDPPINGLHWMLITVAPYFAHVLPDRLIHPPILPAPGEDPAYDRVLIRISRWKLAVRDLLWCVGEALLWVITYILVELYRAL